MDAARPSAGSASRPSPAPVLLFDGECGLCQNCVRALVRLDHGQRLRFAPLQSPPAQAYLRAQGLPTKDFDTLVFVPDWNHPVAGAYRLRTDGLLAAAAIVGGWGRELANLRALPRWLRDLFYKIIGRTRYALFGPAKNERWRPEDRERMLPGTEVMRY